MADPASPPRLIRFGVFEVDLRTGELRKHGLKIRLQEQPFEILTMLLARPGDLVTREELQEKLWPGDTFVDFDNSLNTGINKIREALGDSADNPRFVETLHRRGYRFVAPVDSHPAPAEATLEPHPPTLRTRRAILGYAIALVVAIGLAMLTILSRLPLPPPRVLGYTQITHNGRAKVFGPVNDPLLTDGLRIFFSGAMPEGGLFCVAVAGGQASPVPTTFRAPCFSGISPSGAQLVICHGSGCDISPVLGGAPRHLGDTVHEAWFADEQTLICVTDFKDISLVKVDGSDSRKVVSAPGDGPLYWPRLSPDGSVIRFSAYDRAKDANSLWEVSADGTNLHPLLPGWSPHPEECCGSWTPDGKYYIFQAGIYYASDSKRAGATQIWAIREKSGFGRRADRKPVQLTAGPLDFFSPAVSKDGKRLFAIGVLHHTEYVRYNPQSRAWEPFATKIPPGGLAIWDDGTRVLYVEPSDGTLRRSKMDGTEQVQLTSPPMEVGDYFLSPDEKRIAFQGHRAGEPENIYIIPAEGGVPQQVLTEARDQICPTWSPDGNSLVFGRRYVDARAGKGGIHIVNLKTKKVQRLPNSGYLFAPGWSPDGRWIVAQMATRPVRPVHLFDLNRGKWVELEGTNGGGFTHWSPDSEYIYYVVIPESAFYRIGVSDHKIEQVASFKGIRPAMMAPFGPWFAYLPGNTLCLLREVAKEEIYTLDVELP